MKLKKEFITAVIDGQVMLVPISDNGFSGVVKSNTTAGFIINCLKEPATKKDIVEKILSEFHGVEEKQAAMDLEEVLETLRSIGALEE